MKNRTFQIKMLKDEESESPKPYHRMPPREEKSDLEDQTIKVATSLAACTALTFGACRVVHCLCKIAEIRAGGAF